VLDLAVELLLDGAELLGAEGAEVDCVCVAQDALVRKVRVDEEETGMG
jgi:hypothetical protein